MLASRRKVKSDFFEDFWHLQYSKTHILAPLSEESAPQSENSWLHPCLRLWGRGVNMAIAWSFKIFTLAVDSLTVVNWMTSVIDKRNRVCTKDVAEMLVKRRLGMISDIIT